MPQSTDGQVIHVKMQYLLVKTP